jgi:hypothetical protein
MIIDMLANWVKNILITVELRRCIIEYPWTQLATLGIPGIFSLQKKKPGISRALFCL